MTAPSVTREQVSAAHQAGLDAGPAEKCPYDGGILAATWRSGWRKARDQKAAERAAARGTVTAVNSGSGL